jgi:hypothetical protein
MAAAAQTNVITRGEGGRVVGFVGGAPLALAADIASIASAHEGAAEIVADLTRRGIEAEVIETAEEVAPAE